MSSRVEIFYWTSVARISIVIVAASLLFGLATNVSASTGVQGIARSNNVISIVTDGRSARSSFGQFTTVQYDAAGHVSNQTVFLSGNDDLATASATDASGALYVAGVSCNTLTGWMSVRTIKYNVALTPQWTHNEVLPGVVCDGEVARNQVATAITISPDNSFVYVGSTTATHQLRISKYATLDGAPSSRDWPVMDGSFAGTIQTLTVDPSNHFLIVGGVAGNSRRGVGITAERYSTNDGSLQPAWSKALTIVDTTGTLTIRKVAGNASGILAFGFQMLPSSTCRLSTFGNVSTKDLWTAVTPGDFICQDVLVDQNNIYAIGLKKIGSRTIFDVREYAMSSSFVGDTAFETSPASAALSANRK